MIFFLGFKLNRRYTKIKETLKKSRPIIRAAPLTASMRVAMIDSAPIPDLNVLRAPPEVPDARVRLPPIRHFVFFWRS